MRKMSLLSLTGLAALGLAVSPAQSGTITANPLPDFALQEGEPLEVDLSDFFASPSSELSFSVEGGSVDGNTATIFAEAGTASFTATDADGDSASDESSVTLAGSAATGLSVDDNNRIVGVNDGNLFINGIVPGNTVDSVVNLVLPAGGGAGTPGGGTPGAALVATVGAVTLDYPDNTGLRVRSTEVLGSAGTSANADGLTATLNADGSYSLATDGNFSSDLVVTFGSSADAVHLVAAPATAVDLANGGGFLQVPAGQNPQADVTFGADGITVTADDGEGILLINNTPIEIPGYGTVTMDYNASAAQGVTMAVLGFVGQVGGNLFFQNAIEMEAGVTKNAATIVRGNSALPGLQIVNNSGGQVTVTIEALHVVAAKPLVDYTLNPNANVDLASFPDGGTAVDGSIADGLAGWGSDINQQGGGAPTLSDDNNFDSPTTAGSMTLTPAGGENLSNAFAQVTLDQGTYVAEAFIKRTGEEGTFVLTGINLGTGNTSQTTVNAATLGDDWTKVQTSSTTSAGGQTLVVVQAAGGAFMVDDVKVRVVDNNEDHYFDTSLLQ